LDLDAARSIENRDELIRTVPILVLTILLFFFHKALGFEPATVALAGATDPSPRPCQRPSRHRSHS
jgi:Na+/H+ antiporter NhaD/arsenite permease-like protein